MYNHNTAHAWMKSESCGDLYLDFETSRNLAGPCARCKDTEQDLQDRKPSVPTYPAE